jgi:mannose-binding lectin 2
VSLDSKNSGEYTSCVKDVELELPAGWNANAYIGLTATTGQLADNHDVLSLLVR